LTVLTYNLFPGLLWSSPWSWTLNLMLHTFLHPVIVIFSQHMPIPSQLFCRNTNVMSSIPNPSLSSLLGNLSFSLMPHIHLQVTQKKTVSHKMRNPTAKMAQKLSLHQNFIAHNTPQILLQSFHKLLQIMPINVVTSCCVYCSHFSF